MRSSRLTSLALLAGVITGGLVLDAADEPPPPPSANPPVEAGVAIPAATPAGNLTSTWYCAGGTASEEGFADHVLLLANPTDQPRTATITALPGDIAPARVFVDEEAGGDTTTSAPAETTTTEPISPPEPTDVDVPPQTRIEVTLRELVEAPLAGAIVEVDGGEVAVEHQITDLSEDGGGRATAPCSSTAAREWSFPWGVTLRGARELLVFMNPFPDDATVNIDFATDEGTRDTLRFQNFVVPGRSVVGAYIDEDVTRKAQVSAQVHVGSGRLVVDRIQTFDGTDPTYEGVTLGLGAPTPAETWVFPDGRVDEGISEQVVVFNPSASVAEIEVEVRLDDPDQAEVPPEPFELTIPPNRFSIVELNEPEPAEGTPRRIPYGVPHSILVHSLNGVPVAAERVVTSSDPNSNVGIGATLGSPVAAPTWLFPGGGISAERDEFLTLLNLSNDEAVTFSVTALADGQTLAVQGLQDVVLEPGARLSIQLSDHAERPDLPILLRADGPVVVERGLYRVNGRGISHSMGIPLAVDVLIPDPLG